MQNGNNQAGPYAAQPITYPPAYAPPYPYMQNYPGVYPQYPYPPQPYPPGLVPPPPATTPPSPQLSYWIQQVQQLQGYLLQQQAFPVPPVVPPSPKAKRRPVLPSSKVKFLTDSECSLSPEPRSPVAQPVVIKQTTLQPIEPTAQPQNQPPLPPFQFQTKTIPKPVQNKQTNLNTFFKNNLVEDKTIKKIKSELQQDFIAFKSEVKVDSLGQCLTCLQNHPHHLCPHSLCEICEQLGHQQDLCSKKTSPSNQRWMYKMQMARFMRANTRVPRKHIMCLVCLQKGHVNCGAGKKDSVYAQGPRENLGNFTNGYEHTFAKERSRQLQRKALQGRVTLFRQDNFDLDSFDDLDNL